MKRNREQEAIDYLRGRTVFNGDYRRGHSDRNRFLDRILDPILGPYPGLDFSSQRLQARELPTTH